MIHMRRYIFTAAAILGLALGWGAREAAAGTNVLKVRDVTYTTGQTVTVYIDVTNEDPIRDFQFYLRFPAGLVFDGTSFLKTERIPDHNVSCTYQSEGSYTGSYMFLGLNLNGTPISGSSGAIVTLTCTVTGGMGNYAVTVPWSKLTGFSGLSSMAAEGGQITIFDPATAAKLRVRTRLEGWNITSGMRNELALSGYIPLTSPYAEAPRTVTTVPTNVADWILLELRTAPGGAPVYRQSYFINREGNLVEADGTNYNLSLSLPAGSYWIVLRHRNHAAVMSAAAFALNSTEYRLYDFSLAASQYYGSGGVLSIGRYCMPAGDINRDGYLTSRDYVPWYNKLFTLPGAGYHAEDLNGDALVNNLDFYLWQNNARLGLDSRVP
ncbi:MAG TPA: hypothetical protein PKI81_05590 [bacterium]|nr:hypothetical protein [bacterium]